MGLVVIMVIIIIVLLICFSGGRNCAKGASKPNVSPSPATDAGTTGESPAVGPNARKLLSMATQMSMEAVAGV